MEHIEYNSTEGSESNDDGGSETEPQSPKFAKGDKVKAKLKGVISLKLPRVPISLSYPSYFLSTSGVYTSSVDVHMSDRDMSSRVAHTCSHVALSHGCTCKHVLR